MPIIFHKQGLIPSIVGSAHISVLRKVCTLRKALIVIAVVCSKKEKEDFDIADKVESENLPFECSDKDCGKTFPTHAACAAHEKNHTHPKKEPLQPKLEAFQPPKPRGHPKRLPPLEVVQVGPFTVRHCFFLTWSRACFFIIT